MENRRTWMIPLTLVASVSVGCARLSPTAPPPTPVTIAAETDPGIEPRSGGDTVVASGVVIPAHEAQPGFTVPGQVGAVAVAEGDVVEPGETLVTLLTDELAADVARAEAALVVAQAELARLRAGPRPGEIAAAEAQLEAAEGALAEATARRDQLTARARQAELAAAQAQLVAAEADWMAARIAYDELQARKRENPTQVKDWEEQEALLRRRAADLSRVAAQSEVAQVEQRGWVEIRSATAVVSTTVAQQDVARAQLALLQAGASSEEIAAAEAAVTQAEVAVEAARIALDQATLHAPFAGTVTTLQISPGETVMPGQAMLTLADLRHLRAETTDLSERDVARVAVGQGSTVYVEALGVEIEGQVVDIAPRADIVGGDVVFAVTIALDDQPPGLRWGVSVEVEIDVD
jgi:multidrug efflux pump subunit AcrA (membrane-fusion protein)